MTIRPIRARKSFCAALVVAGLVALAVPAAAAAPTAVAQSCNPAYGCTTTTAPPAVTIHCVMDIHAGPAGITVTIACAGIAAGTPVTILWNGHIVATGVTLAGLGNVTGVAAGQAQAFNGPAVAAAAAPVSHISYPAPNFNPATYQVTIAGTTFNQGVGPFALSGASTPASTGSSLAHTGITVLLWVVVALALVAVGYLLTRALQRRADY